MLIRFTRDELLRLGLLVCKHCGYPPNNHFDHGNKLCAHNRSCPGYEDRLRMGKLVERPVS